MVRLLSALLQYLTVERVTSDHLLTPDESTRVSKFKNVRKLKIFKIERHYGEGMYKKKQRQ